MINLGCKVNKYELDCLARILVEHGYDVVTHKESADYYVVNTCAVTNEAEKKSRQYIGKLAKLNANAKIVVMGCASQANPKQFQSKPNVITVIGTTKREDILTYLKGWDHALMPTPLEYEEEVSGPMQTKTRAYLKIQDGCDNFCSYCSIPYNRGRSRSRKLENCLNEAKILAKTSKEIVVTGIDMSSYTVDGKPGLGILMHALGDIQGTRFRLGSLEVGVITKEFLSILSTMPNFCPQFHLSLQSACDKVLYDMNRHYTFKEYLTKIKWIRKFFPNANITTDLIVGYPTETNKDFLVTLRNIKKVHFGDMHIFPFSQKAGTVASKLKDLPNSVKKERFYQAEKIKEKQKQKYLKKNQHTIHQVLVEEKEGEYWVGYTENYIKTYLTGHQEVGVVVTVRLQQPYQEGMMGKVEEERK